MFPGGGGGGGGPRKAYVRPGGGEENFTVPDREWVLVQNLSFFAYVICLWSLIPTVYVQRKRSVVYRLHGG